MSDEVDTAKSGKLPDIDWINFLSRMAANGVRRLLVKELSPNDNSKNQPYLSGSMDIANILPTGDFELSTSEKGNAILKARLSLLWLQPDGSASAAPNAKLIFYPQYPEVRFSGFLLGARNAPNDVLTTREDGRLLFLGVTQNNSVIAWACGPRSKISEAYRRLPKLDVEGVFRVVPLPSIPVPQKSLMQELARISRKGWIESKALAQDGSIRPCNASHCIGYTLEAELGVPRNGRAEPDFDGWEIKASQVKTIARPQVRRVLTLMTPEPTGGYYRESGAEAFVRKYGYADKRGRPDRLNFGGVFRANRRDGNTSLTLRVAGFDLNNCRITDADGAILLQSDNGQIAAKWSFAQLLGHWSKKHNRAAYVAGERQDTPVLSYRYSPRVDLAIGTDFVLFLSALAKGDVYYDPAIKVEDASGPRPRLKQRSQFRVSSKSLPCLYREFSSRDVTLE